MTDKKNPRARLDEALEAMRDAYDGAGSYEHITQEATAACAEALSLLVDAQLTAAPEPEPEPDPEPDPRESLPDDTLVGNGWVVGGGAESLLTPYQGRFTRWLDLAGEWGSPGAWRESDFPDIRPATVGDLRRLGVPTSEWPDITAPEPEPEPSRAEKAEAELRARELHHFEAEQSEAKAIAERDNAIAALRAVRHQLALGAAHLNQSDDVRETYRKSWMLLEAGARSHDIDLNEEAP